MSPHSDDETVCDTQLDDYSEDGSDFSSENERKPVTFAIECNTKPKLNTKRICGSLYDPDTRIFTETGALHPDMEALLRPEFTLEDNAFTRDLYNGMLTPDAIVRERIMRGRVLSPLRWACLSRAQYKFSCGMSSLTSVFNFLFSTINGGKLPPITQEMALLALGFRPPFNEIHFGSFTGNTTLFRWFAILCEKCGVTGSCGYLYRRYGPSRTPISPETALLRATGALASDGMGLIYHCNNHYNVPVGFEQTHMDPRRAYSGYDIGPLPADTRNTWLIIGDPSKTTPPLRSLRWEFINRDVSLTWPDFVDARHPELGVQDRVERRRRKAEAKKTKGVANTEPEAASGPQDAVEELSGGAMEEAGLEEVSLADAAPPLGRQVKKKAVKKKPRNVHCLMYFTRDPDFRWDAME